MSKLSNKVRMTRERFGVLFQIERLKVRARALLKQYHELGGGYDCGKAMAEYINPELSMIRIQFNDTM